MNGGTYSEALKAGFNADQAGFLARLSIETQSEAVDEVRTHVVKPFAVQRTWENGFKEDERRLPNRFAIYAHYFIFSLIGAAAGVLFSTLLS